MPTPQKLKLKLLVDNEKKRVVFAEADSDFVDILFSFLTLPMGTIVRLLDKKTSLGCLDKLYESVEKLDEKYLETEACKTMLLRPLNASRRRGSPAQDLVLNVDNSNPQIFYICGKPGCCIHSFKFFSSVPNASCGCGRIMDFEWSWAKKDLKRSEEDGVFVREVGKFIISDDLQVMPASTVDILKLIRKLGIQDGGSLEEMTIDLTEEMILNLLKRSLLSKSPLSGICFQEPDMIQKNGFCKEASTPTKLEDLVSPKSEDSATESKILAAKVLVCKQSSKVVYAETVAQEGLVDLLFSLLTFPLGSIVKLLDKCSSIGCVGNLFKSVENLSTGTSCMMSDEHIDMLIAPKLAPFFGCSNSLLPNVEMQAGSGNVPGCPTCVTDKIGTTGRDKCKHGKKHVSLDEMNPKRSACKETGGGYAKEAVKFMITDELEVTPFSPLESIKTVKKLEVAFANLDERVIRIGETQALNLLKSCLTSQSALSNIFLPDKNLNLNLTSGASAPSLSMLGNTKHLADASDSVSSITNATVPAFTSAELNGRTAEFNRNAYRNQLSQSTLNMASHPKPSVPASSLPHPFSSSAAPAAASTTSSLPLASLAPISIGKASLGSSPAGGTNQPGSSSTSTSTGNNQSLPSSSFISTQSQNSLIQINTSIMANSLPAKPFGASSFDTKSGVSNQMASVSTTISAPGHSLSSSSTLFSQSHKSSSTTSASLSTASLSPTIADQPPPVTSATVDSLNLDEVSSKSQLATTQSASREVETVSKNENNLLPTNSTCSPLRASLSWPGIASSTTPLSTTTEKDKRLDVSFSQEDEMEEEAPDTTTLSLGSLGGFGLGSSTPSSSVPKPNTSTPSPPVTLTAPAGELFRPVAFSLPSVQPVQTSQLGSSGGFSSSSGGGFSGVGQPAQMGVGQQAPESVLGTFGQSQQLGSGMPGIGFASSSSFSGGISLAANTGGFATTSCFAGTHGGFAGAAAGGGFTPFASAGGGFAAAAAKGGGFAVLASGGGFAGATSGGGFGAVAPPGDGFGTTATAGGGFTGAGTRAGFMSGGFGAFGSNQGGCFSAFGGTNAAGARHR